MHENTQTSMVEKIHEKHRKTWIKNTQNSQKKKKNFAGWKNSWKKKPTVRENFFDKLKIWKNFYKSNGSVRTLSLNTFLLG